MKSFTGVGIVRLLPIALALVTACRVGTPTSVTVISGDSTFRVGAGKHVEFGVEYPVGANSGRLTGSFSSVAGQLDNANAVRVRVMDWPSLDDWNRGLPPVEAWNSGLVSSSKVNVTLPDPNYWYVVFDNTSDSARDKVITASIALKYNF